MLVLSRKVGESVMIGDDIVVTVVRFDNGAVRLGIEAPRELPVARNELIFKQTNGDQANSSLCPQHDLSENSSGKSDIE